MDIRPKISVVVPVYNAENFLELSLNDIVKQTFSDIEIICVDDGSTDKSLDILQGFARRDKRFVVLSQKNKGGGAARNYGLSEAKGKYIIFLDSDDLFSKQLLEKTYALAEQTTADIVAFNFLKFDKAGNKEQRLGIRDSWLPQGTTVFNYKDCPDRIMSIINPTPWNKLYRREFIIRNNLKFEEISSSNDITFAAVSVACADRITYLKEPLVEYRVGHSGTITSIKAKKLHNVITAVSSAVRQVEALPYSRMIIKSIYSFAIDNYIFALKNNIIDFNDDIVREFYDYVHEYFRRNEFDDIYEEDLQSGELYQAFCTVRKHNYEAMRKIIAKRLIVSLTSFPARIHCVVPVLETIYAQTRQPDEIILWLAEEQFPGKEADLPEDLMELIRQNRLTLGWCDDLKPHKKYFYTMKEYPDAVVVTIDDDIVYPNYTLEHLYNSYLLYPEAVSACRVHLIVIDENKKILPYSDWIRETDACMHLPSMQLIATGCSGVLYPPGLLSEQLFNKKAIFETCLLADDLWLKAMELVADVPVVLAQSYESLSYVSGSQEEALSHVNLEKNQNDIQLEKIIAWLDELYGQNYVLNKLTCSETGEKLLGVSALCKYLNKERYSNRRKLQITSRKLEKAYEELVKNKAKLQYSWDEKTELKSRLQYSWNEKAELKRKLQKTYDEKAERGVRIKELEEKVRKLEADLKYERMHNETIKKSHSYRIGRCFTKPVRIVKQLLKNDNSNFPH